MRVFALMFLAICAVGCGEEPDLDSKLVNAAQAGNLTTVQELVAAGANLNGRRDIVAGRDAGQTPLLAASGAGHADVVEFLLKKGADTELAYADTTPLQSAAFYGHSKCVALLLKFGAKVNVQTVYGFTPLINASRNGHAEVVRLLLQSGADPNLSVNDGHTALSSARARGFSQISEMLQKANAVETRIECVNDKRDLTAESTPTQASDRLACPRG